VLSLYNPQKSLNNTEEKFIFVSFTMIRKDFYIISNCLNLDIEIFRSEASRSPENRDKMDRED